MKEPWNNWKLLYSDLVPWTANHALFEQYLLKWLFQSFNGFLDVFLYHGTFCVMEFQCSHLQGKRYVHSLTGLPLITIINIPWLFPHFSMTTTQFSRSMEDNYFSTNKLAMKPQKSNPSLIHVFWKQHYLCQRRNPFQNLLASQKYNSLTFHWLQR